MGGTPPRAAKPNVLIRLLKAFLSNLNYIVIFCGVALLVVDYILPIFHVSRLFSSSYAASILIIISTYSASVLADLYARNALKIMLEGTTTTGVLMQIQFASLDGSVIGVGKQLYAEAKELGWRSVSKSRKSLVATAMLAFIASTLFSYVSSNLVSDSYLLQNRAQRLAIPSLNTANPFGMAQCSSAVANDQVSFQFNNGPSSVLGEMLEEIYSTGLVSATQAVRNATARYGDDFIHVTHQGTRYTVMLPLTDSSYTQYTTTLLGLNVTCAVKAGDKNMGTLANQGSVTAPVASLTLPSGFTTLIDQTVAVAQGYTAISDISASVITAANADPAIMAMPACSYGVCNTFSKDLVFALKCGIAAVALKGTVVKGVDATDLTGLGSNPSGGDVANLQRAHITSVESVNTLPAAVKFLQNAFSGFSKALQWGYIARAYRFIPDPATYILSTSETTVARDYETMLAYAAVGLAYRSHNFDISVTGVTSTSGCPGVAGPGATGTVKVTAPTFEQVITDVIVQTKYSQTAYSTFLWIFVGVLGFLFLVLLPPVAVLPSCCRRRRPPSAKPDIRDLVGKGDHELIPSLKRLIQDASGQSPAGTTQYVLVPEAEQTSDVEDAERRSGAASRVVLRKLRKSSRSSLVVTPDPLAKSGAASPSNPEVVKSAQEDY